MRRHGWPSNTRPPEKPDCLPRSRPYLTAERGSIPYGSIATALDMSESTARVTLHRLRKRFREVFRETVADTVCSAAEAENEIREVLAVLSEG